MRKVRWLAIAIPAVTGAPLALADDVTRRRRARCRLPGRWPTRKHREMRPESDKCMQDAGGDDGKVQACDDKYSECLKACEGG